MAPVFLIKNIFFLGTVVLISIMDPVICIANFGAYIFVIGTLFATWGHLSGGIPGLTFFSVNTSHTLLSTKGAVFSESVIKNFQSPNLKKKYSKKLS